MREFAQIATRSTRGLLKTPSELGRRTAFSAQVLPDVRTVCAFFGRKYHDTTAGYALKYLLDLDDPPIGSPHKPTIPNDTPRPQQGAMDAYRSFGKREIC